MTNNTVKNGEENKTQVIRIEKVLPPPLSSIDFASLPWNMNCSEKVNYLLLKTTSMNWDENHFASVPSSIFPYAKEQLNFSPATTSLNYGTTIWEGLKCFRTERGRCAVFRPEMNWARFCRGAEAMCLPAPSYELFMRCVQVVVQANANLIPPLGEGVKLYIRPLLYGSGQQLGIYPSPEISMCFYVSPTGNYFKNKTAGGLKLHLETTYCRASRGGTGNIKCSGNYAVTLRPLMLAKKQGFHDNLYVELETYAKGKIGEAIIQELSAANIFLVLSSGLIVTPSLERGTILPGVTRDSVIQIVEEYANELQPFMVESTANEKANVQVVSRDVSVNDFYNATEVFVTGTAAEIVPVASIATGNSQDEEAFSVTFKYGKVLPGGPVTVNILRILREVMCETRTCTNKKTWLPDPFEENFCTLNG